MTQTYEHAAVSRRIHCPAANNTQTVTDASDCHIHAGGYRGGLDNKINCRMNLIQHFFLYLILSGKATDFIWHITTLYAIHKNVKKQNQKSITHGNKLCKLKQMDDWHNTTVCDKSVFSYLRMLTMWHCPHLPATAVAIDRYLLPAVGQCWDRQRDRQRAIS